MRRLYSGFAIGDLIGAATCMGMFVVAPIAGMGAKSLIFLGAGVWWLLFSCYWASRARAARRHRELREERLERERKGLVRPRG